MLEVKQIEAKLLTFLREHRDLEGTLGAQTCLVETGLLDSLLLLDLVVYVQRAFGVTLGVDDISCGCLRTVASLAGVVWSKSQIPGERAA